MHLTLSFTGNTAYLAFDRKNSATNLLDIETLEELSERLEELEEQPNVSGLLIRSNKPNNFIAGSNLMEFSTARGERLDFMIATGQALFNRIADLPFPTVAAIHGSCLGGGYELALACDWRIASDSAETEIGMTETQLGILPAWGGTSRLPDLLGLQEALPIILSGNIHSAELAKRTGLVDEIVPKEHLKSHALGYLSRGKRHHTHNRITHNQAVAALTRVQAQRDLQKKTNGHYPGLEAALEVAVASVGRTRTQSQQAERDAIVRLFGLPQTANLLRIAHLKERAKETTVNTEPNAVRKVAVIGAGTMGLSIACSLSSCGIETIIQDGSAEALAIAMESISKFYADPEKTQNFTKTEAMRGMDRIHPAMGIIPLHTCDLIIDTTSEDLAGGRERLADLASRCRQDTFLATTCSTLPVGEIATSVPNSKRVVGLNFPHPAHLVPLVEVIHTDSTSDETLATVLALVRRIGKLPVVVRDSPGGVINRILMPYLAEAAAMFERGGDPEDIDHSMLSLGMPIGPLRLLDEIGLDVALRDARALANAFTDRMKLPKVVEKLTHAGHTGCKAGGGFYVYDDSSPAVNAEAIGFRTGTEDVPENIQTILSSLIAEEAKRCLADGIVASADDINLAMVLGAGYPPFLGGSLAS